MRLSISISNKSLLIATMLAVLPIALFGQEAYKNNLDLRKLVDLLSKNRININVDRLRDLLADNPKIIPFTSEDLLYYNWLSKGLSFKFQSGKLATIFMYAEGADNHKQYQGELPANLSFGDTRADVERKLGAPETSGGDGVIPYWVEYKSQGVSISYILKDTKDMNNHIHSIGIGLHRKESVFSTKPSIDQLISRVKLDDGLGFCGVSSGPLSFKNNKMEFSSGEYTICVNYAASNWPGSKWKSSGNTDTFLHFNAQAGKEYKIKYSLFGSLIAKFDVWIEDTKDKKKVSTQVRNFRTPDTLP